MSVCIILIRLAATPCPLGAAAKGIRMSFNAHGQGSGDRCTLTTPVHQAMSRGPFLPTTQAMEKGHVETTDLSHALPDDRPDPAPNAYRQPVSDATLLLAVLFGASVGNLAVGRVICARMAEIRLIPS